MKKPSKTPFGKFHGLTTTEWVKLKHEWRLKLKESGFVDKEFWTNHDYPTYVSFMDNTQRNGKTGEDFLRFYVTKEAYFRMLGIAVHHTEAIPEKWRAGALLISEGKTRYQIAAELKMDDTVAKAFSLYIYNRSTIKTITEAVRQFDLKCLSDLELV